MNLQTCGHNIKLACRVCDMARSDYGTVCHENLFKFTQTTSGCDVAIGAPLITWHAPAVSAVRAAFGLTHLPSSPNKHSFFSAQFYVFLHLSPSHCVAWYYITHVRM